MQVHGDLRPSGWDCTSKPRVDCHDTHDGGVANAAAVAYPELKAAVPFYGLQPKAGDVPKIKAALLHFGGLDTRVNAG